MTIEEKAICEAYTGICFLIGEDRNKFYEYISKLFGRKVYTHELPRLADEIKERAKDDFIKVCKGEFDGTLVFSQRKDLAEAYKEWCLSNVVADCPLNVITFLQANGLLNVEKAKEFIQKREYGEGSGNG